jgi:hypothetical protein
MESKEKPSPEVERDEPPKVVMILVRGTACGEYGDEYEDYFLQEYSHQRKHGGEAKARRWAYRYAAKVVFFAAYLGAQAAFFAALERIKRIVRVARR